MRRGDSSTKAGKKHMKPQPGPKNRTSSKSSVSISEDTVTNHIPSTKPDVVKQSKKKSKKDFPSQSSYENDVVVKDKKAMNGSMSLPSSDKARLKAERESLVLWRKPITTLQYCFTELLLDCKEYTVKLWSHKAIVLTLIGVLVSFIVAYQMPGTHQQVLMSAEKHVLWWLYWIGLGVLSSVGLGTGLHTFLLYLGPHIAAVTLAAQECGTLQFPEPPYPDEIVCPEASDIPDGVVPSIWAIMAKVRVESMLWGAGTALGELPPYFMARAARLSGLDPDDDEELAEFEDLQKKIQHPEDMTLIERMKAGVERLVERVGFFGILACASIPNPLFDLAGLTCGHFLVPFWTFFGATLLGKAVVKMHLQQVFVIVAFNEVWLEALLEFLAKVPWLGLRVQAPFRQLLDDQRAKLHHRQGHQTQQGGSLLASLFEKLILIMVFYFVISIVNSLAQRYHKRLQKTGLKTVTVASSKARHHRRKRNLE